MNVACFVSEIMYVGEFGDIAYNSDPHANLCIVHTVLPKKCVFHVYFENSLHKVIVKQ